MSTDSIRINPFLLKCIKKYRSKHLDGQMRENYRIASESYRSAGIQRSWEEHLMAQALNDAMQGPSNFLTTLRTQMDLPPKTIDALYACRVDTVADLLQITEEEWDRLAQRMDLDTNAIKKYVQRNGYSLYRSEEATFKIPALDTLYKRNEKWTRWTLGSLEKFSFDIHRPTLQGLWFEEYYRRYERVDGEEKLLTTYLNFKPECPDNELPDDYREFFTTIRDLWEHYEDFCESYSIKPKFVRPTVIPETPQDLKFFSNDRFLSMTRTADKEFINILEQTYFFRKSSIEEYLKADDMGRVDIVEKESSIPDFQYLLILHIELRVNLDNILRFLKNCR